MKTVERTRRRRLPLFVLPTVLFPGARIPLHVFEARYRQMVARCLEYDRRFGLLFHREDLHGPFHIQAGRVGCVAEIVSFSPLPDGRSLMVTEGVERFRIVDGVESDTPYHEALVEEYGDEGEDDLELNVRRQGSVELFETLLRSLPEPLSGLPKFDSRANVSFAIASAIESCGVNASGSTRSMSSCASYWRHSSSTSRIPTEKSRGGLPMRAGARNSLAFAPIERTVCNSPIRTSLQARSHPAYHAIP